MGRARESAALTHTLKRSLDSVVSEESLLHIREHVLRMTVPHTDECGVVTQIPYEVALWERRARAALKGSRDAHRSIDRLLYGWREKDSDVEQRIAAALGVTLDVARRAVMLMQSTEQRDAHTAARGAASLLVWYSRTHKPIDRSVRDAIEQAWRECERDISVAEDVRATDDLRLQ